MTHSSSRRARARAGMRPASFALLATVSLAAQAQTSPAVASTSTLGPVVVNATRFPDDADKLAYGVSVITAEQIRRSGVSTVNEAVIALLGVPGRADLSGGGDRTFDLRGFGTTSDNNQVIVVDGLKLSEGDIGGTRLAGIPIDTVDRIEVIRGSGSVLYGEGATGGVIVITTKGGRGVDRKNQSNVSATMGSYSTLDLRGNATVAAGGFSVDAAASHRESDGYRDHQQSSTEATSATAQWQGEHFRLGTTQSYDRLSADLPGSLTTAQYAQNPRQAGGFLDHTDIRSRRSTVFSEADFGNWQLGLDLGWRDKMLQSTFSLYDIDARNASLRARHAASFGAWKNALAFGIDTARWQREYADGSSFAKQTSRAFYAKDDVTLPTGTRVSLGGRIDDIEKTSTSAATGNPDDTQHAWELGLTQPITTSTSVYGRIGHSYRLANADEFTFTSPGAVLRPQTSRDTELGARWSGSAARAEVRVYRSNLTDEIGYDAGAPSPFGPPSTGANVNYEPTRRQGVELEVSGSVSSSVDLRATAARREARFEGGAYDGKQVPLVPKAHASLQAGWQPTAAHRLDGYLNWVSSQHPDFANVCSMPSYTTMDVRYAFRADAVELAFGVKNLTDRKYATFAYSCTAGAVNSVYPEDGRAFSATVRVSF